MDGAYDDHQTLQLALDFGYIPVVPPRPNRLDPWQLDRAMDRKRNEIERLFGKTTWAERSAPRYQRADWSSWWI
jgi:hypothetical protein